MHTPHPGAFDKDQAVCFQQRIYGVCVCVCVFWLFHKAYMCQ